MSVECPQFNGGCAERVLDARMGLTHVWVVQGFLFPELLT